jgi:transposase
MKKEDKTPSLTIEEVKVLQQRAEQGEYGVDSVLIAILARLVISLWKIIEEKKISISRLKRLLFGPSSEKRNSSAQQSNQSISSSQKIKETISENSLSQSNPILTQIGEDKSNIEPIENKKKRPGHGRKAASEYTGAKLEICKNLNLRPGDKCPSLTCGGKIHDPEEWSSFIRLEGSPVINGTHYKREVLRCSRCGDRYTAPLPEAITEEKYTPSADATIAIMKYFTSMPFARLENLQLMYGIPLPSSIQFERCESVANIAHPIYLQLQRDTANNDIIHVDDTTARILSLMKENKLLPEKERKGIHTTGITTTIGNHQIAFYISGRRHSGENLGVLMLRREEGLEEPMIVGDAASKNFVGAFKKIIVGCLVHGRRKFIEIEGFYEEKAKRVIFDLAAVYKIEDETILMTPQQRLEHHQKLSKPIMEDLKKWMEDELTQHQTEPNSSLGRAMKYMLRHWVKLTRFLEIPKAPLDNNKAEAILRKIVLNRKNSLFFKTEHGAAIADVLISVIETCYINGVNAYDYLITLINNARQVRAAPSQWMPWNYHLQKEKTA